jgi:hypothetical protein
VSDPAAAPTTTDPAGPQAALAGGHLHPGGTRERTDDPARHARSEGAGEADPRHMRSVVADGFGLTPRDAEVVPLVESSRAHALLERGGLRGRVVLIP